MQVLRLFVLIIWCCCYPLTINIAEARGIESSDMSAAPTHGTSTTGTSTQKPSVKWTITLSKNAAFVTASSISKPQASFSEDQVSSMTSSQPLSAETSSSANVSRSRSSTSHVSSSAQQSSETAKPESDATNISKSVPTGEQDGSTSEHSASRTDPTPTDDGLFLVTSQSDRGSESVSSTKNPNDLFPTTISTTDLDTSSLVTTQQPVRTTSTPTATAGSDTSAENLHQPGRCLPESECAWQLGVGLSFGSLILIAGMCIVSRKYKRFLSASQKAHRDNWHRRGLTEHEDHQMGLTSRELKMVDLRQHEPPLPDYSMRDELFLPQDVQRIAEGVAEVQQQPQRLPAETYSSIARKPIPAPGTSEKTSRQM